MLDWMRVTAGHSAGHSAGHPARKEDTYAVACGHIRSSMDKYVVCGHI